MPKPKSPPKLTRHEAIALIKQQEPGINFAEADCHTCSMSQLVYLANLRNRLKHFKPKPDFPGSMGRQVYEFLARTKFDVFFIWQNRPSRELLTVEMSRREALVNLRAYRQNAPEMGASYSRRALTAFEIDQL